MTTGKKVLIALALGAATGVGVFFYMKSHPPTFSVDGWDATNNVGTFSFGNIKSSTSGNGQSGRTLFGWSVRNTGNSITIYKGGIVYKEFTVTGPGVIKI